MKAVQISKYGGVEVLEVKETSTPNFGKGQILVEVHAASVNPFDVKFLSGMFKGGIPLRFPYTPGGDFSGTVIETAESVTDFRVGDKVYGSANVVNGGSGSFAEIAIANAKNSAIMPTKVSFLEAAALPLVGSSAVQAVKEHIGLKGEQKILIHGGAGGIGHVAIQLAKSLGAYVATTVATDDVDYVKELGADEVIDYKKEKFEEKLRDYDAVYDTVGGETVNKSFRALKKGGILVSMLGAPNEELAKKHEVTAIGQSTRTESDNLARVAEFVDEGKIKVNIDKIFPLEKVREAFTYQAQSSPRGKVVLKIK